MELYKPLKCHLKRGMVLKIPKMDSLEPSLPWVTLPRLQPSNTHQPNSPRLRSAIFNAFQGDVQAWKKMARMSWVGCYKKGKTLGREKVKLTCKLKTYKLQIGIMFNYR